MVERACSNVAVFVETSASVPHHVSDRCSSRALVFSGWSSCDCEKSLSRPAHCNTSCVPARGLRDRAMTAPRTRSWLFYNKRHIWCVRFYICVYMYIYMWTYMNTCVYMWWIYIHIHLHLHTHISYMYILSLTHTNARWMTITFYTNSWFLSEQNDETKYWKFMQSRFIMCLHSSILFLRPCLQLALRSVSPCFCGSWPAKSVVIFFLNLRVFIME